MSEAAKSHSEPAPSAGVAEVKYSLPQLLFELKAERSQGAFAMEKLDQHEIGKLFKVNAARRAKPKG